MIYETKTNYLEPFIPCKQQHNKTFNEHKSQIWVENKCKLKKINK